jgi:hypothetical protein
MKPFHARCLLLLAPSLRRAQAGSQNSDSEVSSRRQESAKCQNFNTR